jgi:hypothetical protein
MSERKEYSRKYYLAHREAIIERHKSYNQAYRERNRAKANEYAKYYYAKNKINKEKEKLIFIIKHNEIVKFD